MDVKFPLAHFEKFIEAKENNVKEIEKINFLKDVKNHIKSITN